MVILAAGGPLPPAEADLLRRTVDSHPRALTIGIDGGARHLVRVGTIPNIVTGDFDSLTVAERESLAKQGSVIVPTPDQDHTDLDKALAYAVTVLEAQAALVFAGTGGRLDHTYSVLSTLIKYAEALDVRLVDAVGETWRVNGTVSVTGPDLVGRTISLLALGPVEDITTTGVRWPLTGESLAPGVRDGTLNQIVADTVTIRAGAGNLLVQLHHASPCYTGTDADA